MICNPLSDSTATQIGEGTHAVRDAEPVTIASTTTPRLRPAAGADSDARACYVLAHGAGAGMKHPSWRRSRRSSRRAASRPCATSSPTWRGRQAARSAEARACGGARRRGRSRAAAAETAADRRRQIVRRPHDLAGAGARRRCRACAASRSSDFRCIRPGSRRRSAASICPTCRSRCCSCKARAMRSRCSTRSSRCAKRSASAPPCAVSGRRSFVPCAGADRPQGRGGSRRRARPLAAWIDGVIA